MLLLFVIIFFVGGGWLIGKLIASLLPSSEERSEKNTYITHVNETHNHLHIDSDTLKEITGKR